ncbi:hypothetical protein ACOSQ2_030752 [Xanthoceras sorbifolium]
MKDDDEDCGCCCRCCLSTLGSTAGSVTGCFVGVFWSPIERQILYLIRYRSNLDDFATQARELEALKKDVLVLVDDAEKKGEEIRAEVLNWHVETMQIEKDVKRLQEKIEKRKGCCHTWCLDWRSRRRLSRHATKKSCAIDAHLSKGKFDSISFPAHPADLRSLPTPDFVPLETSLKAINSIIGGLKDEKNKIIGVHGCGGIGKTTLMKQVIKQVDKEIHFNKVFLVKVAQTTPNLKRIQDDIAKLVGFEIEGDGEYQRAATLSQRLKLWKKVLIILDDVWERLDLATIGIPYGEEHKGCKIVVTSRVEEVCNKMESDKNIEIEELTEHDRLKLFKITAGLADSNAFDHEAEEVVRRCGKLPNEIALIGKALRNKPANQWNVNDAINKERKKSATTSH